ncbi:MAG: hypothetical protein JJT78_11565 [Leptospira sp.]|nr:hypothetical protein [Leptospira sp.]
MNKFNLKLISFILVLIPGILLSQDKPISIRSLAYDFKSGKFLYSENHTEYYNSGTHNYSIVKYKDPKEKVIAQKKIEFGKKRTQPDFFLEDFRTGYYDKARLNNASTQSFTLEHQRSKEQGQKSKTIQVPGLVVVDGGFDYFIRDNFEDVSSGKTIKGNFVLTNRLDYFQCRVKKTKDLTYKGRDAVQFVLTPENFIIRSIADKIIVTYDKKTKRLLEYIGISNLQDDSGDDFPKVKIVFKYKEGQLDTL